MKTKLELAKAKKAKKQQEQADIAALVSEIKRFNEAFNDKQDIDLSELTQQLSELPQLIAEPLHKSLEGFLVTLKTYLTMQKQTAPDLSKLIKNITIDNKIDIKPITKEIAKLRQKAEKQSQNPEDFVPYRRVVKLGNKFFFDDNMTASGSGGGGGSTLNTIGLATEAKQDDIITAVEGISSGGVATPLDTYTYIQKDTSGATYKYYGYADANTAGGWAIKRITIATNLAEFTKGSSDYTTNWTGRAGLSYASIWSTF